MDHDLDTERIIQAALLGEFYSNPNSNGYHNLVAARSNAYCPYSKFRVGAALLSADGQVITGANVENASYGGTICAERTALVKAVSEGVTKFKAIAVASDVKAPISPCGMCRQFMREFCELDMPVVMVSAGYNSRDFKDSVGDHVKTVTLEELLPYSFGPEEFSYFESEALLP